MTLSIRLTGATEARAFLRQVMTASGQNLVACLQCGKCTGGCPVAWALPYGPRQTIEMIQLGLKEEVLSTQLPWVCVGCTICASRCPVQIDFSRVASAIVEIAVQEERRPAAPDIHTWEETFLASVQSNGRVREVRSILEMNLRAGHPWRDAFTGLKMIAHGMIGAEDLLGHPSEGQPAVGKIFANLRQVRQKSSRTAGIGQESDK